MKYLLKFVLALAVALGCGELSAAPPAKLPLLHPLFCDHAVLQREMNAPVWGWTEPEAQVTVKFAGQTRTTLAGADGRWLVKLKPMPASSEPRTLTVESSAGHQTATIKDILVGDVWLCSGQSNMEMGIGRCNAGNDIATANFPNIRLLTVPKRVSAEPLDTLECHWAACSPESLVQGGWNGFSAVAFYFGRDLYRELNIPIGLIHSSWGGTVAEAWTSAEALKSMGDFKDSLEWVGEMTQDEHRLTHDQIYKKWCLKWDSGTQQHWEQGGKDDSAWKSVQMPQPFERIGLQSYDGMVWFRHEFTVPELWAGKDLQLDLSYLDDYDTTWVNGEQVGQTFRPDLERHYVIPATAVHPGKNLLAIRVLDTGGLGGLMGSPERLQIKPVEDSQAKPVALAGEWQMCPSMSFSDLPALPPPLIINNPNVVTFLYNAMIAPLVPFTIKGAIWYQGEANADRAHQYQRLLPTMIADWRKRFDIGDFPFYIVSLAAFTQTNAQPRDNNWAEIREAQAMTAKNVRHSGLAVTIDVGEANDIHPKDKYTVGHRLALNSLAQTYGKKIEYSGPWYRSMHVRGNVIRIKFDHAGSGLKANGDRLTGFAIAGKDRKFVWANAMIDGDSVLVSSSEVPVPVAVRYAWDANPLCDLYNGAGLPAVPFRTDRWPGITK